METQVSTVEFFLREKRGKKKISFNVEHNLPEVFGLSLSDAVNNWVHRTEDFSAESLSAYINSKNTGYTCKPYNDEEKQTETSD